MTAAALPLLPQSRPTLGCSSSRSSINIRNVALVASSQVHSTRLGVGHCGACSSSSSSSSRVMASLKPGPSGLSLARRQQHPQCSSSSSNGRKTITTAAASAAAAAACPFPDSARRANNSNGNGSHHQRHGSFGCEADGLVPFRHLTSHQPELMLSRVPAQQQLQQQSSHRLNQASLGPAEAGALAYPGTQAYLGGNAAEQASAAAAAAAVAGVQPSLVSTTTATPTWQISSHIRHSVEEALRAGINMAIVHMPGSWQQQQQQVHPQEGLGQQSHPTELEEAAAEFDQAAADAERISSSHEASTSAPSHQQLPQHQQQHWTPAAASHSSSSRSSGSSRSGCVPAHVLTKQIQACASLGELDALLQQQWQQLDHIHVAAAFTQLVRTQRAAAAAAATATPAPDIPVYSSNGGAAGLSGGQSSCSPDSLVAKLEQLAIQQLPRMQSRHIANILWAGGSLNRQFCQPLLQGLLDHAAGFLQAGTSTQGFANIIWGLASIRVSPPKAWLATFFAASQPHLFNFQPQELSSTIWALATLGVVPPLSWQDSFLAASTAKMGICSAQALSNQLWAVAKLQMAVSDTWWSAITYTCQIKATEFTPAGFANLMWAAGNLAGRQQHQQQPQQLEHTVVRNSSSRNSSSTKWIDPLVTAALPQLQQQSGHAISNIVWGLAVLEHQPSQQFLQACFSELMGKASTLTAAAAACSLWGFSKLGFLPGPQDLAPLLQQLQQVLGQSRQQHLVYIAAAFAHFKQLQHKAPSSSSSSISNSSNPGNIEGDLLLPRELQQQFLGTCCTQLHQFSPGQLIQLGRWLVAAGIQPDEQWTEAFLSAAAQQLHKLHAGHRVAMLRLIACWRVKPHKGWSAMFLAAVTAAPAVSSYSADTVGALLQGFAAAALEPQEQQLELLLQRTLAAGAGLSAAAVAAVLQGLSSLCYRPSEPWLQRFWAAASSPSILAAADAAALAALAATLQLPQLQQLKIRPSKQWAAAYHVAVLTALPQMQPKQAAAVLAALAAVRRPPKPAQQQLLPQLMAVAGSGLQQLQLHEVVSAWWCLAEFQVLTSAVQLQQVAAASCLPSPAAAAAAPPAQDLPPPQLQQQHRQQEQEQQQQQQHWQQRWQAHWLQHLFFSPGVEEELSQLCKASLLQLSDCLGRLQQPAPGSWAGAYVAAVTPHIPELPAHELVSLVASLQSLGGAESHAALASALMTGLQPALKADSLSPAQLSEVLVAAQAAGIRPPESWLADYVMSVSRQLSNFRGRQLIWVLTSLARLRFVPDASFLAAASHEAVEKLGAGVPPAMLVDLLWALTALHVRPSSIWIAKFEGRMLEKGLEQLDGQQLSRFGWCLAALQRKPGQLLMAKYLVAAGGQLSGMDARSLSDTLWACAMLDEKPGKQWLDCLFSESRKLLASFPSSMLVTVLWSLALLQQRPPSDWMTRCLAGISSSMEASAAAAAAAAAAARAAANGSSMLLLRKPTMQPAWVDGSGSSTSSGQGLDTAGAGVVNAASVHQQQPLSAQQLTRLAWALAALDCQVPAHFMQQLMQQAESVVEALDADSLAQLVWALDRLDETHEKLWVRRFAATARARLLPHGPGGVWGAGQLLGFPGSNVSSSSSSRFQVAAAAGGGGVVRGAGSVLGMSSGAARLHQVLPVAPGRGATTAAGGQPVLLVRPARPARRSSSSSSDGSSSSENIAAVAAAAGIVAQEDIAAGLSSLVASSSKQQLIAKLRKLKCSSSSSSSSL